MAWFLRRYLIVTGIGAALVLAMPWLVLLGFLALIVPGILLAAMPSAFLYGVIFTAGWYPGRRVLGEIGAVLVGLSLVFCVAFGLPAVRNATVAPALAAWRGQDRLPPSRVSLSGILRIERPASQVPRLDRHKDEARAFACDDLCAASLFTPGISAVILAEGEPAADRKPVPATTYRLVPRLAESASCPDATLPVEGWNAGRLGPWPDLIALRKAWKHALAEGLCLRRDPTGMPLPEADWTLRFEDHGDAIRQANLCRSAPRIQTGRVLLAEGKREALRHSWVTALELASPLVLVPTGGLEDFRFDCNERRVAEGVVDRLALLSAWTSLGLAADSSRAREPSPADLRASLAAALADPRIPADAAVFGLVRPLFEAMAPSFEPSDIRPGDAALIARMIADPRIRDWLGIHGLLKALGAEAALLRGPLAARLLSLSYPQDREPARMLGHVIGMLPAGLLAEPTPDETHLLADDARRRWATGLVRRQADRGAAAVPDLLGILSQAMRRPVSKRAWENQDRLDDAKAASEALCLLGPEGSEALPGLEALLDSGQVPRNLRDRDGWALMLARLGKPVERIAKPEALSGTQDAFADRLRRRLARFRPEHCAQG